MSKRDSILFVSHDAFRGGATLMLLSFLRWLKKSTDIPFQVLLCQRGQLEEEFAELAPVWYLDRRRGRRAALHALTRRFMRGMRGADADNIVRFSDLTARINGSARIGLIYSNTVVNGRVLEALSAIGSPVITHAHELEYAIQKSAGADFELVKRHTNRFIAVSEVTRRNLVDGHGIPEEKVECIRGFIDTAVKPRADVAVLRKALAAELGIPVDARIVGACGAVYWLKGCDLFLQLGVAIRKRVRPGLDVHLVWVGEKPQGDGFSGFQHDIDHAGLEGRVHFIGAKPNPLDYIAAFDVHALVSREESLSLVMLEAAMAAIPTVCFADAGGASEFVEGDAGAVVPYLDVEAMADRVIELLGSDHKRLEFGRRAREKARERHDIEVSAPALLRTIERLMVPHSGITS